MSSRTTSSSVNFSHPFVMKGFGGELPAGIYEIVAEEKMIESLSFTAYRRAATYIVIENLKKQGMSQLLPIDHRDLELALARDQQSSKPFERSAAALSPPEDLK